LLIIRINKLHHKIYLMSLQRNYTITPLISLIINNLGSAMLHTTNDDME
jgi:hypothetical protein